MKIYQVWDWDPMASNWGDDYLAATYASQADAEQDVERRNAESRARWVKAVGAARVEREPSLWNKARWNAVSVK